MEKEAPWSPCGPRGLERATYQLTTFLQDCGITDYRGKRILELGFYNGLFQVACQQSGLNPTGLEVVEKFHEEARQNYPHLDWVLYDGHRLPFADESFDYVVSFQVLEHVVDLDLTVEECVRILKPGGYMYHVMPNYRSFYEGHYPTVWLPFLSKSTGRTYMKLIRKYTPYYETLNIIKPQTLRRISARHAKNLEVLSLGRQEFIKRFNREQIAKIGQPLIRFLVQTVYHIPLLSRVIMGLIACADMYYPLTLIARKGAQKPRAY